MYRGGRATSRYVRFFVISLPSPSMYEFFGGHQHVLNAEEYKITVFKKKNLPIPIWKSITSYPSVPLSCNHAKEKQRNKSSSMYAIAFGSK